jgi:hypothetical protein
VQIVGQLLQSTDTTEIGSALLLAVAIAQTPVIAVRFANLGNGELVGRFFTSNTPNYVLHAAGRILLALAAFVELENDDTIVRETIDVMIVRTLNRTENPRLVLACLQVLVFFLEIVGDEFAQDVAIGKMTHLLHPAFVNVHSHRLDSLSADDVKILWHHSPHEAISQERYVAIQIRMCDSSVTECSTKSGRSRAPRIQF